MNIDKVLESLEGGFKSPSVALYKTVIEDKYLEQVGVRRPRGSAGQTHHTLWALSLGETGQQPAATFYGPKASITIKKALAWRGFPTVSRGPRSKVPKEG